MFDISGKIEETTAAEIFSALSGAPRLRLLKSLLAVAPESLTAGSLAAAAGLPASTASFHLAQLERTGLIRSKRASRSILYAADPERLGALVAFLLDDCCGGRAELCAAIVGAPGRTPEPCCTSPES